MRCTSSWFVQSSVRVIYQWITHAQFHQAESSSDMKWASHVAMIVQNVKRVSYMLSQSFKNMSLQLYSNIYISFIRLIRDCASPVWNPYFVKDKFFLKQVRRRITRLSPSLWHLATTWVCSLWILTVYNRDALEGTSLKVSKYAMTITRCNLTCFVLQTVSTKSSIKNNFSWIERASRECGYCCIC